MLGLNSHDFFFQTLHPNWYSYATHTDQLLLSNWLLICS